MSSTRYTAEIASALSQTPFGRVVGLITLTVGFATLTARQP